MPSALCILATLRLRRAVPLTSVSLWRVWLIGPVLPLMRVRLRRLPPGRLPCRDPLTPLVYVRRRVIPHRRVYQWSIDSLVRSGWWLIPVLLVCFRPSLRFTRPGRRSIPFGLPSLLSSKGRTYALCWSIPIGLSRLMSSREVVRASWRLIPFCGISCLFMRWSS